MGQCRWKGTEEFKVFGKSSSENVDMVELRGVEAYGCDWMWKGKVKTRGIQNVRLIFL